MSLEAIKHKKEQLKLVGDLIRNRNAELFKPRRTRSPKKNTWVTQPSRNERFSPEHGPQAKLSVYEYFTGNRMQGILIIVHFIEMKNKEENSLGSASSTE